MAAAHRDPDEHTTAPFGTLFTDEMAVTRYADGVWEAPKIGPVEPLSLHPATHALHYSSACFEGLKAHRGVDGVVRLFRLEAHVRRLHQSATTLMLPSPPEPMVTEMIVDVVRSALADVPEPPGSLYLRPTLLGTDIDIGGAAHPSAEAILFVLASPVGDYFAGGIRPLSVAIETEPRTAAHFGMVKSGANYVMALGPTMRAQSAFGVDQVLFAPRGLVQETGASNFLLLDGETVVTPELTPSFLHGVTRDSVLRIAEDLGCRVEERTVTVDEVVAWAARPDGEAALSGTAAVMSGVGELVVGGERIRVGTGEVGPQTLLLRQALTDLQTARHPDPHHWLTPVMP